MEIYTESVLECEICGKKVKAPVKGEKKSFICQQCAKKLNTT